jgi:hypothetical protein
MKTKTMETTTKKVMNMTKPSPLGLERISWLINEKKIHPEIAALDLEMIKMKLALQDEGEGWTAETCDEAEIEYKRFLHLNKMYFKAAIVPTERIDIMWHYHILDTRAYHKDSEAIFGGYFHHFPYFGLRGEEDKQNLISSFEETKILYEKEFGEKMLRSQHADCWHDCQGRCWHACSSEDKYK